MKKINLLYPLFMTFILLSTSSIASNAFDSSIKNNTLAISPDGKVALAAKSTSPEVIIYNLHNGNTIKKLTNYISPRNIIFSPDGDFVYISDSSKGTVSKVNTLTYSVTSTMPIGPGAFGSALTPDGNSIYVNNQASNTVTVYDTEKSQPISVITGFSQPRQGIKSSADGKYVYVTNFLGDKVTIVDTVSKSIKGEINGFNKLRAISITKDGKTLFAANSGSNQLSKVDLERNTVVKNINVGMEPYGAALRPDEKFIYSGNLKDNSLTIISLPSFENVGTINGFSGPRQAISFTKDSKFAWVLNEDLSISKVDLNINKIVNTIHPK